MSSEPVCASIGANTCLDRKTIGIPAPGYYCKNDLCIKCPVGTYGTDGQNCLPCPFATWSNTVGQKSCGTSFTYSTPGLQKSYIPYGVTKIIVKLWGGGGGSDTSLDPTNYVSHAGGSGGYASCNITVPHSRNVYLIIGGGGGSKALTANAGGFGGGGKGYAVSGISSGGGGGRSAVQLVLGTDAVTAGGGGGGSDCPRSKGCGGGGAGGAVGLQASDTANGRGATATAGGAAGIGLYCNGTAGTKYTGGNGCRYLNVASSAGGGGGYYGGGGGSSYGANNKTHTPFIYEIDGGGGGGSAFGGGCNFGTFFTLPGNNGNQLDMSRSGGMLMPQYVAGVGVGGAGGGGGGNAGGNGYITLQFVANYTYEPFSAMPSSMPSSAPTGQPTGQPTTMPTIVPLYEPPTSQPTSRPTDFKSGPLYANSQNNNGNLNAMNTQTAIIVFSCVGAVVLCLFIVFTCYFQDKYHNRKEEEKLHSLVEHHYNEDEVILDDGEGGEHVANESGYYRQFGTNENPIHSKDEAGNIITAPGLTRGASSYGLGDKKQSFVLRNNRRGKLVTRTSVSTINENTSMGDMTARSGASTRSMHSRSSNQIVSQVRVKDFQGTGPSPRLIRMVANGGTVDEIARSRFLAEHQDDVIAMSKFFRKAGLTQKKSQACAEEAICLDANSPRKLNKYVHEVNDFNLMNLGMDEFDADMVREALHADNPNYAADHANSKVKAATVGGISGPGSPSNQSTTSTIATTNTVVAKVQTPEEVARTKIHDHDVADMIEFFRFAGLSVNISRHCAEQSVNMDANSPRKLFKYLENVQGFMLTDLGMDTTDADMVLKALKKEYGTSGSAPTASEQSKAPVSAKTGKPRNQSIIMDVDMRDDSSDDGEDEVTTNDSHANSNHAIKNTDVYDEGKGFEKTAVGNLTDRSQDSVSTLGAKSEAAGKRSGSPIGLRSARPTSPVKK